MDEPFHEMLNMGAVLRGSGGDLHAMVLRGIKPNLLNHAILWQTDTDVRPPPSFPLVASHLLIAGCSFRALSVHIAGPSLVAPFAVFLPPSSSCFVTDSA